MLYVKGQLLSFSITNVDIRSFACDVRPKKFFIPGPGSERQFGEQISIMLDLSNLIGFLKF